MHSEERIVQYKADITYGMNSEFGFDYLRDNMKSRVDWQCQRDRHFAIIDEVDSILIDEARTPLIISGPAEESSEKYYLADRVVRRWVQGKKGIEKADLDDLVAAKAKGPGPEAEEIRLQLEQDYHFVFSEKQHTAYLSESGIVAAQRELGIPDFYAADVMNENWPHHLEQAVRAHTLYTSEKEYVVKEGEVIIVDEFTGRLMEGRRWSDGLHQAVEAKEGIKIREENQTLATVTIQNFFRLYDKLAGMTGTALTEAAEFHKIYKLDVLSVPTNRPLKRDALDDRIYLTEKEKWKSVVEEIVRSHHTGRPVLVGTTSIETNERLSAMLVKRGVAHEVLNAKQHEREAAIIAKAGQLGAVTIATNMAGRGTDILLGEFAFEELLDHWRKHGLAPKDLRLDDPAYEAKLAAHWAKHFLAGDEKLAKKTDGNPDAQKAALEAHWAANGMTSLPFRTVRSVAQLGGLHIVGTERHEARRIDNQLRGRAGRQGDPGSSVFYVSLEDVLMRKFARDWVKRAAREARHGRGRGGDVADGLARHRARAEEGRGAQLRHPQEPPRVRQGQRRPAPRDLRAAERDPEGREARGDALGDDRDAPEAAPRRPSRDAPSARGVDDHRGGALGAAEVRRRAGRGGAAPHREPGGGGPPRPRRDQGPDRGGEGVREEDLHRTLRYILLQAFDDKWKEHLRELDALREAVGLRGYAQQDPKVEYRREASQMFQEMQVHIAEAVTDLAIKVRVTEEMDQAARGRFRPAALSKAEITAFAPSKADETAPQGSTEKPEPIRRDTPKVGRNDPCPCGSGRKYKKCHGAVEA